MKLRLLLLATAAAGMVFAQGRFGPGAGPDLEGRLTKTLNLTAEQQNAVHTALQEHRTATSGLGEQQHTLTVQLHAAIKAGQPDQIDKITTQLSSLHQQMQASQAKAAAKIYSTLTPDQKTQIGEHLELLMMGGGPAFGPGGPGGARGARKPAVSN